MGIAESPLRDRVIFVQGAPRSGTTWLVALLATHPQIAGVEAESHLFDFGLDRLFDNHEGRDPLRRGLDSYLDRGELINLARDLCDGVFMAMRSHVSVRLDPQFVVEKTPAQSDESALDLRRKIECFPDAWYVHIVRDGDAVTRSLMRAPWMSDRSAAACARTWRRSVESIRDCLANHPRYREIRYEELRDDPAQGLGDLFGWLGVSAEPDVLETVRRVSAEHFSDLGAVAAGPATDGRSSALRRARRSMARTRTALRSLGHRPPVNGSPSASSSGLGFAFARALRQRDEEALRSVTAGSLDLVYRSPEGDARERGEDALRLLLRIAHQLFDRRHVGEWWASAPGQPAEWWTSAPGHPLWTVFFSALGGEANRVDVAFALWVEDDRIARLVVLSVGPLPGRPLRQLAASSLAATA